MSKEIQLNLTTGDIFLCFVDNSPAFYARVNEIAYDSKPGWYEFLFSQLGMPIQHLAWKLQGPQINGEHFTMGGKPLRIQKVDFPPVREVKPEKPKNSGKVIDITERIKQRQAAKQEITFTTPDEGTK
jgi:hypothetical protein